jgi:hypothetical protein
MQEEERIMIQSREYSGEADYQRVRELLIESYAITETMHNWGIDCWDWFRFNEKVVEEISNSRSWEKQVRLWEMEGERLVGVVILDGGDVFLQIHPHFIQIEKEMLDWVERYHKANRSNDVVKSPLNFFVYDYDRERQALLLGLGYKNLGQDSYMRRRSFGRSIPNLKLPQGYSIRTLAGSDQEDLEKRAAVANNAFNITKHSAQTIQMLHKAPTYLPELDLVIVGPDGTFAAYCVVWFDDVNQIGMFGPVGTRKTIGNVALGKH